MRKLLEEPFDSPAWPADVYLTELDPDLAREVHDLLILGYQNGGGSVAPFSAWWSALLSDSEFDPSLCFLARDKQGIVGVAQCWTSAFVKDLVVHPRRRKEGIGVSLLLHAYAAFYHRGASTVDLKVEEGNTPAIRLYLKSGMQII
ncbi:GNAT family N-acetyltransferase [Chitinophaga silvisoli]|uniref:GNAT family N-acetyltransferase n=1 Tax=Chitinophaga silvisoli TaxID=2291814 RepID=A0A3E1P6W4_9BACT|nr:GNAT family N-acetyltransferase [Chitinophaga silvisoli]RFM35887.1 GNAT family N-acetyltransferase [Chitinophaga silvisoli]